MKEVEYFHWMLPPDVWSKKPRKSTIKLTEDEAKALGALQRLDETREVRQMPETESERMDALFRNNTSGWQKDGPTGKDRGE